jgi:L,D-peptidoglycan transpeptidase YkuD (ErfK/YbiS/YcfS/YnhG family)
MKEMTSQLLLVISKGGDCSEGQLYCFERNKESWDLIREAVDVSLGKNGMGWGNGLHKESPPEHISLKMEGDLRSPAGVFSLGTVFGYERNIPSWLKMPYLHASSDLVWVDDPSSKYYNFPVYQSLCTSKDWKSAERMLRDDILYRWGILIEHNVKVKIPGRGSCIFMHLRE